MWKLKHLWGFVLAFLAFQSALAQQVKVVNAVTGEPIQGVFVYNKAKKTSATSTAKGEVDISAFGPADTLCFQHQSYDLSCYSRDEIIDANLIINLFGKVIFMKGVEVVTERELKLPGQHPQHLLSIPTLDVQLVNPGTSADMLQATGQVNVQRSQMGGGSPVIRGFEANKVLLVVDGVRMNNAIYRSGHLQNAITIDPNALQSTEVSFGPASVVYGSDALGGVVHFYTQNPTLARNDSNQFAVNALTRFASATEEKTGHIDLNFGTKKFGSFTSFTMTEFGDLTMGNVRAHGYDSLGLIYDYVSTEGSTDIQVSNPNPEVQVGSGYRQYDAVQKFLYQANAENDLILNMQLSTSTNIPRYDQMNDYDGEQLKWAEWYYGPQNRYMGALEWRTRSHTSLYDRGSVIAAVQQLSEDRIKRRFGRTDQIHNEEDVTVYSLNADFVKQIDSTDFLYYGLEGTFNDVVSKAYSLDILSGEISPAATRYPDNGSNMTTAALYISYKKMLSDALRLDFGSRYSHTWLYSAFADTTFVQLPFDEINISNGAITGSMGLLWKPDTTWQISPMISSGFRNPNVDDFGKVFEKNGLVTVPNEELLPEYALNGEIGIAKTFMLNGMITTKNASWIQVHGIGWYTLMTNAIVRREHQLNGEDSLLYEGDMARIVTNTNAASATLYGFSFNMKGKFGPHWRTDASINYTYGRDTDADIPLGHISPLFGRAGINWTNDILNAGVYSIFNGWKRIEDFAPDGVDNEEETTADGTPPWYTLNASLAWQIHKSISAQLACKNILDHHIKPFASGISMPGRNFVVALRLAL